MNHLLKVKSKLEQTLDELEDSLEREKKTRGEMEKSKRKVRSWIGAMPEVYRKILRCEQVVYSAIAFATMATRNIYSLLLREG